MTKMCRTSFLISCVIPDNKIKRWWEPISYFRQNVNTLYLNVDPQLTFIWIFSNQLSRRIQEKVLVAIIFVNMLFGTNFLSDQVLKQLRLFIEKNWRTLSQKDIITISFQGRFFTKEKIIRNSINCNSS